MYEKKKPINIFPQQKYDLRNADKTVKELCCFFVFFTYSKKKNGSQWFSAMKNAFLANIQIVKEIIYFFFFFRSGEYLLILLDRKDKSFLWIVKARL